MTTRSPLEARASSRTIYWAVIAATFMLAAAFVAPVSAQARNPDRAAQFMQQVANELIAAQRGGGDEAFARVIRKYGHVPAIGMDALGSYRAALTTTQRQDYYNGLVRFIARYAATESQKYTVVRAEFPSPGFREGQHVLIDSRIFLSDGSQYDVRWMLVPRENTFKVRDAQVIGFWVSPFLTQIFERHINDNGGRVEALVAALRQF
ncbi:MAG: ABC transporter substrate-binding protein [Hyphomicrobiaceae bacterium]